MMLAGLLGEWFFLWPEQTLGFIGFQILVGSLLVDRIYVKERRKRCQSAERATAPDG